jgi:hypothetical protein
LVKLEQNSTQPSRSNAFTAGDSAPPNWISAYSPSSINGT